MTDPGAVQAALKWADDPIGRIASIDEKHVMILASRVRELEAAEVERQGRVCGRCQHRITQFREDDPCCGLTQMSDGVHVMVTYVPCRFLGHTCGAWSPRGEGTA